jgi:hypothetical protein
VARHLPPDGFLRSAVVLALAAAAVALVALGVTVTSVAGSVGLLVAMLYAARRAGPFGSVPAPELVSTDLPAEAARDRYTVAAASATPFGGELSDRLRISVSGKRLVARAGTGRYDRSRLPPR